MVNPTRRGQPGGRVSWWGGRPGVGRGDGPGVRRVDRPGEERGGEGKRMCISFLKILKLSIFGLFSLIFCYISQRLEKSCDKSCLNLVIKPLLVAIPLYHLFYIHGSLTFYVHLPRNYHWCIKALLPRSEIYLILEMRYERNNTRIPPWKWTWIDWSVCTLRRRALNLLLKPFCFQKSSKS